MKTLGVSEKQIIKLEISANILKKNFFNTLKQHYFFNFIYSFEGVWCFWVKLCIFFSKLLSATRQQLFYVTECDMLRPDKDLQTMLHSSGSYWF